MATDINYTSTNDVRIYTINTANLNGNSNAFQYTFFLTLNSISVDRLVENYSYILKIDNKRSYTWTGAGTNITYKIFANTGSAGSTSATYQRNSVSLPSFSNTSGNLFTLFSGSVTLTKQLPTDYSWFTIVLTNTTSGLTGTPAPMNYSYRAITTEVPLPLKLYPETAIKNIADSIRLGTGGSETYTVSQMAGAISSLTNSGGDYSSFMSLVELSSTISNYLSIDYVSKIRPYFFLGKSSQIPTDTSISYPNVTEIGSWAFNGCKNISGVYLPKCEFIGVRGFGYCSGISQLNLSKLKVIESEAFTFCTALVSMVIPSCKYIGPGAFRQCSSLSSIVANNCLEIGDSCFAYCKNLSSINFTACLSIGSQAFSSCSNLTYVSIPKCKYLSQWAFDRCYNLTTVYAPLLESVSAAPFYYCSSLANCTLPNLKTGGSWGLFCYCTNLQRVSLPLLEFLPISCFTGCTKLSSLSLPKVSLINNVAFSGCSSLASLYLMSQSIVSLAAISAFYNTPMWNSAYLGHFGSIYVPSSLVESYKSSTNWTRFSSLIVGYTG